MGGMKMPLFSCLALALLVACAPAAPPASPAPANAANAANAAPAAHPAHAESAATSAQPGAHAESQGAFGAGAPVTVTLHLRDDRGAGIGPEQLQTVHEQKLHVLIVDPSLADYSHVHPTPLSTNGDWQFSFTPKHDRPYRLWLDATPVGGKQAYTMLTVNEAAAPVPVEQRLATQAQAGDLAATLSFDKPPRAGAMAAGRIELTRGGKPMTALEPVMGAYAHIVGIAQDWQSIAHVHPMGPEPHAPDDRGGPALRFHLEPAQPGYLALHLQVRVEGKDVYLPFGIEVQPGE
jgi:hypothetical protein